MRLCDSPWGLRSEHGVGADRQTPSLADRHSEGYSLAKITKHQASNGILRLGPENHSRKVQGRLSAPPPPNPVSSVSFRQHRTGGGVGDEDEHRSPWRKGSRVPPSEAVFEERWRAGEILCERIEAQEGAGEQEVVPRGAILAHSRVEYLFRVRAAPSGDQDCPAKAIVLPPSPSPSQAPLNLKSDISSLYPPPTRWVSPPRN